MNTDSTIEFADVLSAALNGKSVEGYQKDMQYLLDNLSLLEKMADSVQITDIQNYKDALKLKGMLSSLHCFSFNRKDDEVSNRALNAEHVIGRKMQKFVVKHREKNSEVIALLRYVLWTKYYRKHNTVAIVSRLRGEKRLYKRDGVFYVTGLHSKIGNNVFTVDNRRLYIDCCHFMAMRVSEYWQQILTKSDTPIPELPEHYDVFNVWDGKYCVRPVTPSQQQRQIIIDRFCHFV